MTKIHHVTIDGKEDTLTLVYSNGAGYQYNTSGNKSAHTFRNKLIPHTKIKTNGHTYVIKD